MADDTAKKIKRILSNPKGKNIKEISEAIGRPTHFTSGFLKAMVEQEEIQERRLGTSKIYYLPEQTRRIRR